MRFLRIPTWICLFLLSGIFAFAQTGGEPEEIRRYVLYFEINPGADFTSQQGTLLYESLVARLSDASEKVALLENRETDVPPGDQEKTVAAESTGADSWLHVVARGDFEKVQLQARCLDLLNGIEAFNLELEKELIRGTRELGLLFWKEVEEAVHGYFEQALSIEDTVGELTFQTVPGTGIRGLGRKRLKTPEDGQATVEVPLPSTIRFRATKPGYLPVEGQIYVDQPEKTVILDQVPGSRLALDFYLNNFNFPGFDVTVFLVPDRVFAKTGILTYLLGFVLEGDPDSDFFVSYTLNHFNISTGFYFNAPDRFLRPYFAAGAFWRIITAKGFWGLEPIAPFGVQPILGFEYSRQSRLKLYFEYAPQVFWTGDSDNTLLFLLSVPSNNEGSAYWPLDWCVINLANFKLGMRLRL